MKYILTTGWEDGVADLTQRLVRELAAGRKVLWLVSGGSNVSPEVQVMDNMSTKLSQNLTILLADERYGKPGHADSNWAQLEQAGFKNRHATILNVLQAGLNFSDTVKRYNQLVSEAITDNDLVIAQFGIGRDGHIVGILPDSPAITETSALVVGFKSHEEPYLMRLTLTFPALRQIDAAYVFAFGNTKLGALQTLYTESLEPEKQPAQILKELPEAYIYNDQLSENE